MRNLSVTAQNMYIVIFGHGLYNSRIYTPQQITLLSFFFPKPGSSETAGAYEAYGLPYTTVSAYYSQILKVRPNLQAAKSSLWFRTSNFDLY